MIDYKSRLCISRNTKWICTFSYFVPAAVIIIVLIIVYNSEFLNINNLFFVFFFVFFCCKDFVYYLSPYRKGGENKRGDNLVIFYKQTKKNQSSV